MLYNVTLKDNAPPQELEKAKKTVKEQGGTITHEFSLIKGFTVKVPDDKMHTLKTNDHIVVEADQVVKTQ